MKEFESIITSILTIIEYQGDKEAWASQFIELCQKQALAELISTLPSEIQEKLQNDLKDTTDPSMYMGILANYIDPNEYDVALDITVENQIREYFQSILPSLNETQKEKLTEYFNTLSSETSSPTH